MVVVVGDYEVNDKGGNVIEESEMVDEVFSGFGNVFVGGNSFISSDCDQFRVSNEGEISSDDSVLVFEEVIC